MITEGFFCGLPGEATNEYVGSVYLNVWGGIGGVAVGALLIMEGGMVVGGIMACGGFKEVSGWWP